ncbi:MAG TPA: hypothetical protein VFY71_11465 [Planctomycetota bacterium]|nr:hypothetical protein [Planctomycetota bacterium]
MLRRVALTLLCAALAARGLTAQQVWVVGPQPGPGVDFTAIQAAVNAAADGDIILVKLGSYVGNVAIANKSLVIEGMPSPAGSSPSSTGTLWIGGLQADRSVVLRNLEVIPLLSDLSSVLITHCEGPALVEDCSVVIFDSAVTAPPKVNNSQHVVFTRCTLKASWAHNGFVSGLGLAGLELVGSDVSLYDCTVLGSTGWGGQASADGAGTPAEVGGPGIRMIGGTLLLAGGEVHGGTGGWGDTDSGPSGFACVPGQSGGPGLVLEAGLVRRLDDALAGGAAGFDAGCGTGSAGADVLQASGSIEIVPGPLRTLEITSPAAAGQSATIALHGQPGELAFLLQSFTPLGTWSGALKGTLAGAGPYAIFVLGPLGADGSLVIASMLPDPLLPPGTDALLLVEQYVVSSSWGKSLSTPSTVLLLADPH